MKSLIFLLLAAFATHLYADEQWPEDIVKMEDMKLLAPMRIEVPRMRQRGDVKGPVVLKVHVTKAGVVKRAELFESSGSPGHDEAAMRAMREVKFNPRMRDGEPVDVTLLAPLHFPMPKYPSRP